MPYSQHSTETEAERLAHYSGGLTSSLNELVLKARQEAASHRPPSNAVAMDQHEVAIRSDAQRLAANEHQIFSVQLSEASRQAHALQQKIPDLEARVQRVLADDSLKNEAAAELSEDRGQLVRATEQRMRSDVELRAFRAKHGITEEASYPESRIFHLAIILALSLGESLVNSVFYQNDQGLLGGFVVALGVSGINLFGSLALGVGFRYKNLRDGVQRAGGWICAALFVLLTVYCNALFAAFRSNYQLVRDPSDAAQLRDAFRTAAEQSAQVFRFAMQFGDFMSFILFGIGILLSVLAFYKGYTLDDRFPGHGAKDKKAKASRSAELALQDVARQKLKGLLQRRRSDVLSLTHEPTRLMTEAGQLAVAVQNANTALLTQREAIQRDFELALRTYRDANSAIRATEAPAYFQIYPNVLPEFDDGYSTGVLSIISGAHERAKALRDRYQEALNVKVNELQRDSAELLGATFAEFLASVEREAEDSINRMTVAAERASRAVMPEHV